MKAILTLALVVVVFISGCTTIHFDNGVKPERSAQISKWHHNFALALYEGSSPINLKKECKNRKWKSIKSELSFFNGFSSSVVNSAAGAIVLGVSTTGVIGSIPIWHPKSIEITCE